MVINLDIQVTVLGALVGSLYPRYSDSRQRHYKHYCLLVRLAASRGRGGTMGCCPPGWGAARPFPLRPAMRQYEHLVTSLVRLSVVSKQNQ